MFDKAKKFIVNALSKSVVGPLKDDATFFRTLRSLTNSSGNLDVDDPYNKSVWVYSSIKAIADNISSQAEFKLFTEDKSADDGKNFVTEGPLYELFLNPNPYMIDMTLFNATVIFMELNGEAIWILERDNVTEIPKNIWCLPPDRFKPYTSKEGEEWSGYWEYDNRNTKLVFAPWEILHIKYFNPYDDIRGMSPASPAKLGVEQDYFSSLFNKNFFKDGAAIGGIIETEDSLTDDQYLRLKTQFDEKHVGYQKSHRVAVMEGGAKFKEVKMSQRDMEFISLKDVTRGEILAAYKTNEVVLGNYKNIQCLTESTDVMTINGFKSAKDIKLGDLLATMNPETGLMEFKPTTKMYEYDYEGDMYTQKKRKDGSAVKIDYLVSPEHKMFGKDKDCKHGKIKSDYKFKRISEIKTNTFASPRNGIWDGKIVDTFSIEKQIYEGNEASQGRKVTEFPLVPWLKFLGWFLTEGCYRSDNHYEIGIAQKKEKGLLKLREDLKDFPYTINEYPTEDHGSTFVLSGKDLYNYLKENVGHYCHEKRIPREFFELHPSLLLHLYNAIMDGDGTKVCGGEKFYTTSKQLAEDVFELAVRIGKVPTLYGGKNGLVRKTKDYPTKRNMWQVYVPSNELGNRLVSLKPEKVQYKGKLYCFEVPPYHTILSRHNGKTLMISQSYEGIRQAHKAFWEETLIPKTKLIEKTLKAKFFIKLATAPKIFGFFDLSNVNSIREDYKLKVEMAEKLQKMGFTINAINKKLDLGLDNVSWGDTWMVPMSMVSVEDILSGKVAEQTAANANAGGDEPSKEKPKKDDPPSTGKDVEELDEEKTNDTRNDILWNRYVSKQTPVEAIMKKKLNRFIYEQRKDVLKNLYNKEDKLLSNEKETEKLIKLLKPVYITSVKVALGLLEEEISLKVDDLIDSNITSYLSTRIASSTSTIVTTIEKSVINTIQNNADKNIEEIAEEIRKLYNKASNRINTIARTEINSVINTVRYFMMLKLGFKFHKWISGSKSRDGHKILNGKVVKLGESFLETDILRFPCDNEATTVNTINCMCYCLPVIKQT